MSSDEGKKPDADNKNAETGKKAKPKKKQSRKKKKAAKKAEAKKAGVTRYDIVALDDGKTYVKASRNIITSDTLEGRRKQISKFFNTLLDKKKAISIETLEGDRLVITKDETAFKARDRYREENGKTIELSEDEFLVKLHAEAHIDELVEVSQKSKKPLKPDNKKHSFAKDGFEYRTVYFQDFDGKYYRITLSIGHNGTVATVYNVGQIKEDTLPSAKVIAVMGSRAPWNASSDTIISQKSKKSTSSGEKVERKSLAEVGEAAVEDLNGNLEYYAVRFVVEERKNQNPILAEANVLGKLYGANAKKIGSLILGSLPKSNVARIYTQPIKHSISDFLQSVKTLPLTNEVFSADAAQKLGVNRSVGKH